MKKIGGAVYFVVIACFVLSLSGCSGSSGNISSNTAEVADVAVLTSPAIETYGDYKIVTGASISGIDGAQYYVAGDIGDESSQATLNLAFSEEFDINSSFAVVNVSTNRVIFAYNPDGDTDTWKTGGNISISGGKALKYNGLTIAQTQSVDVASVNLDISDSEITYITLNSTSATLNSSNSNSTAVPSYNYVWHCEPDSRYEYFTKGIYGSTVGNPSTGTGYENESDFLANNNSVYIARDIHYMTDSANFTGTAIKDDETEYAAYYDDSISSELEDEYGSDFAGPYIFAALPKIQGSSLSSIKSLMTHSANDAYKNPVLHITEAGVYSLTGTWTGQISIEADAIIILNGVTITCTVAPAVIFNAAEYGDSNESSVAAASMDLGQNLLETLAENKANIVLIADGTTNTVTGANLYRLMKAEPKSSAAKVDGTDISDQKKRYKTDGAFYSYVSLAVCGEEKGTGVLNINSSTFEGLDSELHLTVESGKINITTPDDGINVNEDNISVFTQLGGSLTIKSSKGDGIDSNGYIIINGGNLNITAGTQRINSNGEAGLDSEKGCYISSNAKYTWTSINSSENNTQDVTSDDNTETNWNAIQQYNYDTATLKISKEESYKYSDANILSAAKLTDKGITAFNIGTGSNLSFIQQDTDTKARNISSSGNVFRLNRKINTFSGIVKSK